MHSSPLLAKAKRNFNETVMSREKFLDFLFNIFLSPRSVFCLFAPVEHVFEGSALAALAQRDFSAGFIAEEAIKNSIRLSRFLYRSSAAKRRKTDFRLLPFNYKFKAKRDETEILIYRQSWPGIAKRLGIGKNVKRTSADFVAGLRSSNDNLSLAGWKIVPN